MIVKDEFMKMIKIVIIAAIFLLSSSMSIVGAMTDRCGVYFRDDPAYSSLENEPFFIIGTMDGHFRVGGLGIVVWWTSRTVFCKTKNSDWILVDFDELSIFLKEISYEFKGYAGLPFRMEGAFFICGIIKPT